MLTENPPTGHPAARDGYLPGALTKLGHAISGLIDQKPHWIADQRVTRWVPSWYRQLLDAVNATQRMGHSIPRSRPSCNLEALDLQIEIDAGVRDWQPEGTGTEQRLVQLLERGFRPQDTAAVEGMAADLDHWVQRIQALLSDERVKTFKDAAACPACQTQYVYRRDFAGEMVRQPALQITTAGCQCQRCRTVWAPQHFRLLALALGYDPPAGVLE